VAREDEDVRLLAVAIFRQSLFGLASDMGQAERPAEPERAIAGTRVVAEDSCGPKPDRPGEVAIGTDADAYPSPDSRRTFADAPNGAAALWQGNGGARRSRLGSCRLPAGAVLSDALITTHRACGRGAHREATTGKAIGADLLKA